MSLRRRRRATNALLTAASLIMGPAPSSAVAAEDFRTEIARIAQRARALQLPGDALRLWGDPQRIDGGYSPILRYVVGRAADGTPTQFATLFYGPSARAPRRLQFIQVTVDPM